MGRRPSPALDQLTEDEEQLERPDGTGGEVVVAVLGVVEVEPTETTDHRQPAHDLLDVGVGEVVPEVDQARSLRSPAACASRSDEPQSLLTVA